MTGESVAVSWWKVFLSLHVLDPHHWNEHADDTESLSSGENISCVLTLGSNCLCVSHWDFFYRLFEPIICNNESSLGCRLFLPFRSLSCLISDGFACSHSFWVFFTCWFEQSDCVAAGCIKSGRTCALDLSALKSFAWGHLRQTRSRILQRWPSWSWSTACKTTPWRPHSLSCCRPFRTRPECWSAWILALLG